MTYPPANCADNFDLTENFSDPFRVAKGYFEALHLMKRYKPDVVFSKGGFVAVPVVLAAKHYKIPVIIHESDMTPGLANKICIPSAQRCAATFLRPLNIFPKTRQSSQVLLSAQSFWKATAALAWPMLI